MKLIVALLLILVTWWVLFKICRSFHDYQKLATEPLAKRVWGYTCYGGGSLLIAVIFWTLLILAMSKELAAMKYLFS